MAQDGRRTNAVAGHPRLVGCQVMSPANGTSMRYVELEKYRLWEHMMRTRHGIDVSPTQLGLWVDDAEFQANPGPFEHGGSVEEVTCIVISWFNPRHRYSLEVERYVPTAECESIKAILLSHISQSEARSEQFNVSEQHGVYVSKTIEEPEVELLLGLSDPDT